MFGRYFSTGKLRENTVSDALPYQELYADGTILTKDWSLLKCYRVIYPDISLSPTAPDETSEQIARTFHRHIDGQSELRCAYWFIEQRLPLRMMIDDNASGLRNMTGADTEIEMHRNRLFSDAGDNLVNGSYACVKVKVTLTAAGEIDRDSMNRAVTLFSELESALHTIGAHPVALTCDAELPEDNIMAFLKYSVGTEFKAFRCPTGGMANISEFLSTKTIDKGKPMLIGDEYVQMMTINDFPNATYPGILLNLMTLNFPFRWSTRWIPYSNRESQKTARTLRRQFQAGTKSMRAVMYENSTGRQSQDINTQAVADAAAVESVMMDLARGETLGELTSCIEVMDRDLERLRKKVSLVHEALSLRGFDAIEETVTSNFQAWKGSLPGDSDSGRRRPLVTATNISHIVPFTSIYHGSDTDFYLRRLTGCGWPHMMGRLVTREVFYLNLNGPTDDIGHTFIVGSTGSGKSVFLSLLASQWARYPGSRVVLFDKDMSFSNICRRSGGAIYNPAADDSPLRFMPLSRIKTKPSEAVEWLEMAIESAKTPVTAEMSRELMEIATGWDDSVPTVERFTKKLRGLNPANAALPALEKIMESRQLANLFGGEVDEFNNSSFGQKTMIEMGSLMNLGDMAVYPALQFIFSRLDELFDTDPKPTLLVMDEAWLFLNHRIFRTKIKEWLKTLRKKRVFVVMAIQNINDIDDPEEFLTSCHTKVYLANPELKGEGAPAIKDAYRKMGITDAEMEIIGNGTRKRDYFIQQPEGSAMVNFMVDSYQLERLARDGQ